MYFARWRHFELSFQNKVFATSSSSSSSTLTGNVMSSEQFENDEVSMVDVLEEDKELEAEANAVFGDSDDQHCTYEKVYLFR